MGQPSTCPVCQGRQTVPSSFYGEEDGDIGATEGRIRSGEPAPTTPCRSCAGTGVVWPPQPVGPLHVTGDLIVDGNIVSSGYREWLRPGQVRGIDVVSGGIPDQIPDVEPYIQRNS